MDTTQWVNSQKIEGKHTVEGFRVDWLPCLSAVGTSAAIAVVLIAPFAIMDWKREQKKALIRRVGSFFAAEEKLEQIDTACSAT